MTTPRRRSEAGQVGKQVGEAEKKIDKLKSMFKSAISHKAWANWRREKKEDRDFYVGNQLSQVDKEELAERGQPEVVVNKIFSKINNLLGAQRYLRSAIVAKPRTPAHETTAFAITDAFKYIQYRNAFAFIESDVFEDCVVAGLGWFEAGVEQGDDNEADIFIASELPDDVRIDPFSRRYDLSDAKFVAREKWVDYDDVYELFPEAKEEVRKHVVDGEAYFDSLDLVKQSKMDDYDGDDGQPFYVDPNRERVRLVEMWYREWAEVMYRGDEYVANLDGFDKQRSEVFENAEGVSEIKTVDMTDDEIMAMNNMVKRKMRVVRLAIFTGDLLLSDDVTPYNHPLNITTIPFFPVFCFRKIDGEPFGVIRQMKSVQREVNKRRSKALHILNTTRVIMERGAVEDLDELREEVARPDAIIEVSAGKKMDISTDINLAATQFNVMQQSEEDLQDISGIFDEAIGKATNARTGIAVQTRVQSSNQNNIRLFDNLRRTKLQLGKFVLGLIKQFYTAEKMFYITDDEEAARSVILNQELEDGSIANSVREARVDIVVEEAQPLPTVSEEQFVALSEMVKSGALPPQVLIESSNIRGKQKILGMLSASANAGANAGANTAPSPKMQMVGTEKGGGMV